MSRLLALGLVVVLASGVSAGGNPDVRMYIDFDPPNCVHSVTTELYTDLYGYVCLDHTQEGVTCVSFRLTNMLEDYPGVFATQSWTWLFPGDLPICVPYEFGATICASECMTEEEGPILVGYMSYFCLGDGPACLQILDHADYPRWVVDCSDPGEVDYYCVLAHGSINGGVCPEGDCGPTPVGSETWGKVKSLYR